MFRTSATSASVRKRGRWPCGATQCGTVRQCGTARCRRVVHSSGRRCVSDSGSMSGVEFPSPAPRRISTPRWLDLRLVLGIVLVLAAVLIGAHRRVAGAGTPTRSSRSPATWRPGTTLQAARRAPGRRAAARRRPPRGAYLSDPAQVVGKMLTRPLHAGELRARRACSRGARRTTTVSVPFAADAAPTLHARPADRRVALDARPARASCCCPTSPCRTCAPATAAGSPRPARAQDVVVSVAPALAQRVVAALAIDDATIRAGVLTGRARAESVRRAARRSTALRAVVDAVKLPVLIAGGGAAWEAGLVAALDAGPRGAGRAALRRRRRPARRRRVPGWAGPRWSPPTCAASTPTRSTGCSPPRSLPVGVVAARRRRRRGPAARARHRLPRARRRRSRASSPACSPRRRRARAPRRRVRPRAGRMFGDPATSMAIPPGAGEQLDVAGAEPTRARCVAVWGPTGAPGRTTVAITLADELARLGHVDACSSTPTSTAARSPPSSGLLDESPGLAAACRLAAGTRLTGAALAGLCWQLRAELRVLTGIPLAARWTELRAAGDRRRCSRPRGSWPTSPSSTAGSASRPTRSCPSTRSRRGATARRSRCSTTPTDRGRGRCGRPDRDAAAGARAGRAARRRDRRAAVGGAEQGARAGSCRATPRAELVGALERFAGVTPAALLPDDRESLDAALATGRSLGEARPSSPLRSAIGELAGAAGRGPAGRGRRGRVAARVRGGRSGRIRGRPRAGGETRVRAAQRRRRRVLLPRRTARRRSTSAALAIFDRARRRLRLRPAGAADRGTHLARAALPAEDAAGAGQPGQPGVGRRRRLRHHLSRAALGAAASGHRARAARVLRADPVAAARPRPPAVGDVPRRGPGRRPGRDRHQDPSVDGRRATDGGSTSPRCCSTSRPNRGARSRRCGCPSREPSGAAAGRRRAARRGAPSGRAGRHRAAVDARGALDHELADLDGGRAGRRRRPVR